MRTNEYAKRNNRTKKCMNKQELIHKLDDIYNEVIKFYPNDTTLEDDVKEILMTIDDLQQKIEWNLKTTIN
jgi:hypothetical protein